MAVLKHVTDYIINFKYNNLCIKMCTYINTMAVLKHVTDYVINFKYNNLLIEMCTLC